MGKALTFYFNHPAEALFGLVIFSAVFLPLLFFTSLGWAIALPWALFAAAVLRLHVKEEKETGREAFARLARRLNQ